jgi:hypothetical protein
MRTRAGSRQGSLRPQFAARSEAGQLRHARRVALLTLTILGLAPAASLAQPHDRVLRAEKTQTRQQHTAHGASSHPGGNRTRDHESAHQNVPPLSLLIAGLAGIGLLALALGTSMPRARPLSDGDRVRLLPVAEDPAAASAEMDLVTGGEPSGPHARPIGEHLIDAGLIERRHVVEVLDEQDRSGGRFGEILRARGSVSAAALERALAEQRSLPSLVPEYEAVPALSREIAYGLRAVALTGPQGRRGVSAAQLVAVTDLAVVPRLEQILGQPVHARLADARTMDLLLADAYAHIDGPAARAVIRRGRARRTLQGIGGLCLLAAAAGATFNAPLPTLACVVGLTCAFSLAMAWRDPRVRRARNADPGSSGPSSSLGHSRDLPECTVLVPLYRESPRSLAQVRRTLQMVDYPVHKLQGLALLDPSDRATRRWLREQPLSPWVTVLLVPRDASHGNAGRLIYGLLQARGARITVLHRAGDAAAAALREPARSAGLVRGGTRSGRQRLTEQFLRGTSPVSGAALRHWGSGRRVALFETSELQAAFGWSSLDQVGWFE